MLIAFWRGGGRRDKVRDVEDLGERESVQMLRLVINNADYNLRIILTVAFLLIFIAHPFLGFLAGCCTASDSALN